MRELFNRLTLFGLIVVLILSCEKEHTKYRFTPKFKVGDIVQYEQSIQHDHYSSDSLYYDPGSGTYIAHPVCCLFNIPQPLVIDSLYYNSVWRDNWYFYTDHAGKKHPAIDELQLQKWTGTLQR